MVLGACLSIHHRNKSRDRYLGEMNPAFKDMAARTYCLHGTLLNVQMHVAIEIKNEFKI
jgi:hypothetical protein